MGLDIRVLDKNDTPVLSHVAPGVFDDTTKEDLCAEFLGDPRHHIAVAVEEQLVVGFVSAVDYVHPDKPRELWINEVGVAPTHQRRGIATLLLRAMFDVARQLGCREAWVLTDRSNQAAMRTYSSVGGTAHENDQVMFTFHFE